MAENDSNVPSNLLLRQPHPPLRVSIVWRETEIEHLREVNTLLNKVKPHHAKCEAVITEIASLGDHSL